MVTPDRALPGRDEPLQVIRPHIVLDTPIVPPFPEQVVVRDGLLLGR